MKIKIAKEIELPTDAVTQTFAEIGRKGAGKTYLASMIAEQMLDIQAQIIVIDPIGNWWGLRVNADGESRGKDIFVIGGSNGDTPLSPEAGKDTAKILAEKNISVVLDISEFRKNERKKFVTDFAEEFYHLKKKNPTPVHIFLEEAQKFVPQSVQKDEARMLGAWEDIVRLGRNCGIGCSLISQRPQSVNKEVLSQVECLCVLQITGLHERKALEEWVKEAGEDRKIIGELPGLKTGEGYVWSPAWLRVFKRVNFSKKTTLDTSKTPELGKATKVAKLSKIDIEKLQSYMTEVIDKAQKELREIKDYKAEISRLNIELKKRPIETKLKEVIKIDEKAIERSKIEGFNECKKQMMEEINFLRKENILLIKRDEKIAEILKVPLPPRPEYNLQEIKPTPFKSNLKVPEKELNKSQKILNEIPIRYESDTDKSLGICARKIYSFLFHNADRTFTKAQVGAVTGYSYKSGGFSNAISELNTAGLIDRVGGNLKVRELDPSVAGDYDFSKEAIIPKLSKCENEIYQVLLENPTQEFSKEELANETPSQYSYGSGGFSNALSKLNTLGLINRNGGTIKLNPDLLEL